MKRISMIVAIIAIVAFFTGCQKENQKGGIQLSITDAPIDSDGIVGVYLTITDVQYQRNDDKFTSFEGFEGPQLINLLDLTRGVSQVLGNFTMEPGTYSQLRFMLNAPTRGKDEPTANPGCYLEFRDGKTQPLFVPSGAQSGFKATGEFTVPSERFVEVTADFDVRKSIVRTHASGKYILKPTIRLIVDNLVGKIVGKVSNIRENFQIVMYAYEHGVFNAREVAEPAPENLRFPNAVSSDKVDASGTYHIDFLAPGNYDLVVVAYKDGVYSQVLGVVEDVVVESKTTTTKDIDLGNL